MVALCKKLSGRIGYAYTPPSNDPAGQDEETTATYALTKECAIEPMNDPDLFDKGEFICRNSGKPFVLNLVALSFLLYRCTRRRALPWGSTD